MASFFFFFQFSTWLNLHYCCDTSLPLAIFFSCLAANSPLPLFFNLIGGQVSPEIAQKCMKTAFDLGINFFDTAEVTRGFFFL